jgi:hypothetical protein
MMRTSAASSVARGAAGFRAALGCEHAPGCVLADRWQTPPRQPSNRLLHDLFVVYRLPAWGRVRPAVQLNVSNLLDANQVMYLVRATNGTLRYAQWLNSPRKLAVTTTLSF